MQEGQELVAAGQVVTPPMVGLMATLGRAEGAVRRAPDDEAAIQDVLEEALTADMMVIAGGVSVGKYDLVKEVMDEMGLELLFWKVRQRPGKPFAFGLLEDRPVFRLPGNPVSVMVCFEQYVRPALAKGLGGSHATRALHTAAGGRALSLCSSAATGACLLSSSLRLRSVLFFKGRADAINLVRA